jgi:hypothetical protein
MLGSTILKMEEVSSSETSVNYQTIGRRILEDIILFKLLSFWRLTPFNVIDVNVSDKLATYIIKVEK